MTNLPFFGFIFGIFEGFLFFLIFCLHTGLPATLRFRRKRRNRNVAVGGYGPARAV